jgi:hypothetical protein
MQLVKPVRLVIIPLVFFALAFGVYAQEEDDNEDDIITIESDWASANFGAYSMGDQTFTINISIVNPLFYIDERSGYLNANMSMGGMGALGYTYFLNAHFFLGMELSGMFCATEGKNMYFIIPIGIRAGYQFVVKRFEFPLALEIGVAPQTHSQLSYFGFFSKAIGSVYFRFNPEWSFGLNTSFWWVPQWTDKVRETLSGYNNNINIHGFFWEAGLAARYHF